jgi:hypothetical protein
MKSRRSIIVIEGFYRDAQAVRNYALRQRYYTPYQDPDVVAAGLEPANWWASWFRLFDECPFKSSRLLVDALEQAVGETIDMEHWRAPFPVDEKSKPLPVSPGVKHGCLWNCCFHVKPDNGQQLGDGVHNHVTDGWNSVGPEGWAGLIYLTPNAPLEGGLHLWRNKQAISNYDWMTPAENWERIDSMGNLFNRLILVRGDIPHSGAGGWGNSLESGRMYQTFFFRSTPRQSLWPVSMPEISF